MAEGYLYHLTHRCADGEFFLRFAREREVDLNMVRAGKVKHPGEWRWCGYDELTGQRERYRIVNQDRLLSLTGFSSMPEFSNFYRASISERLSAGERMREPCWTEAVAVGSEDFVDAAETTTAYRRHMQRYEVTNPAGDKAWAVRDPDVSYRADSRTKSPL
jgi:hypothetical protein